MASRPPSEEPIEGPAPTRAAKVDRMPTRQPLRRKLSDEEIMRAYQAEEADPFFIDLEIVPEGLVYEWKRHEVYGKDDKSYEADLIRRGWVPVMTEEHPGYFMPVGHKGQVVRLGQGLYKMESNEYWNRQRYQQLLAKRSVSDQEEVLGITPANQFARTGAKVTKNYEAAPDVE